MSNFYRPRSDKPQRRYLMNPASRVRAGHARARMYAHVVEGKLYTTMQVVEILGVSRTTVHDRIKRGPYPLTWANLMKSRLS